MNSSIELLTNSGSVWKFEDPALESNEFVSGFLYGGMFLLKQLPSHYFVEKTKFPHTRGNYRSVDELDFNKGFIGHKYVPLGNVEMQTEDHIIAGSYIVWLRDPTKKDTANSVTFMSPVFLQGLFTALNLAQVPYEKVVLHKPIKDGVAYNIQGLNLPNLPDLKDITYQ